MRPRGVVVGDPDVDQLAGMGRVAEKGLVRGRIGAVESRITIRSGPQTTM